MPDIKDLPEGISLKNFANDYGSLSDNRYQKIRDEIQKRILELPCYKKNDLKTLKKHS
jgi:hypothetical protein